MEQERPAGRGWEEKAWHEDRGVENVAEWAVDVQKIDLRGTSPVILVTRSPDLEDLAWVKLRGELFSALPSPTEGSLRSRTTLLREIRPP
jgi:hypothetical protein